MLTKALVALAFASSAFATVFVTQPVQASVLTAGQPSNVNWQESGTGPSLKDFGPTIISIYAGNAIQQTRLQTLNESVDVSQVSSIAFTPDASIGPNSNEYFIRFESLGFKDPDQPQYPALAFSAKFALQKMTGVFSAEVLSQIQGQSTAPLASGSASAVSTKASASATTTNSAKTSATSSGSTPTQTGNAAVNIRVGWVGAVLAAAVGASMF